MKIKVFVLLFALLMCLGMVACQTPTKNPSGTNDGTKDDPSSDTDTPTDPEEKSRYDVEDSLPATGVVSYGTDFVITHSENYAYLVETFWVEDDYGGALVSSVYAARAKTEERFDVNIYARADGTSHNDHSRSIRNQIASGKPDFDVAHTHDIEAANMSLDGLFINLRDVEEFDFSKPWWPKLAVERLTYMDQMYLMSSSMSYHQLANTACVFANKTIMEDYGYPLLYETVLDGDWTLELLISYAEDFYADNDFSETKTTEDTFGLLIDSTMYYFIERFGIEMVYVDDNGELIMDNGTNSDMYEFLDYIYGVCYDSDGGYLGQRAEGKQMFGEGRGLFIMGSLGDAVTEYSHYEIDYSILPTPKLNDEQEEYIGSYGDFYITIPNTCTDTSYVGTILESMSAEGYRMVTPVYFDTVLKGRYSKDKESTAMIDLIHSNLYMNIDYIYGNMKWYSRSAYMLLVEGHSKDFASYYQQGLSAAEERLAFINEKFSAMDK